MKAVAIRLISFGVSFGVAGCTETPPAAVPVTVAVVAPVGTTNAPPARTRTAEIPPIEATHLASATAALGDEPDLDRARLLRALRDLAEAIAAVVPSQYVEVIAIQRAADELETSPRESHMHAEYVRYGLLAAVDALVDARPDDPQYNEAYRDAVMALDAALEELDSDRPLRRQVEVTRRAFQAATRAVFLAASAVPPDVVAISRDVEACVPDERDRAAASARPSRSTSRSTR